MPSIIYIINNTAGQTITSIPPLGSNLSVSDMRLYGLGHLQWGEGVDENLYKLTENFACPAKLASPGYPQDDTDLGPGNGINNPLNGQLWYNTTQAKLFVYDAILDIWKPLGSAVAGPVPPASPAVGDLWYDTSVPQLKVWSGLGFVSVADRYVLKAGDTMTGFLTLHSVPMLEFHAATKGYVDDLASQSQLDFVNVDGDTMTDFLTLHANPVLTFHAATKQYVDNALASVAAGAPILLSGLTFKPSDMVHGDSGVTIFTESNGNEHNNFDYERTITISSVRTKSIQRNNAPSPPGSFSITSSSDVTTPNVYSVPSGTTHVLVRVRFNVNVKGGTSGNIGCTMLARKDASDAYRTKIVLDPNSAGGITHEGEDGHTFVIAITASNTFDIQWTLNTAASGFEQNTFGSPAQPQTHWDNSITLYLEGYYILDQTGGMTQAAADLRYVNVIGDTMTGPLAMSSQRINFLGDGLAGTDAINLNQLNAAIATVSTSSCLCGAMNNVTGLRSHNVVYTNSFGKDMLVMVSIATISETLPIEVKLNGLAIMRSHDRQTAGAPADSNFNNSTPLTFVVESGNTYEVAYASAAVILHWIEYR